MSHDHNHNHEERELITLVDDQGNETLFEILLTIDGKEEFGKNYVLLVPVNAEEDENGEVEIFPFQNQGFVKNKFLFSSEEGLQELTQIFESSPKIQVSNKSVTFDNEIYDWENYNIEFEIGTITVSDLKKNTILEIEAKNTVICREILLKKLIENFDKKYPKFY